MKRRRGIVGAAAVVLSLALGGCAGGDYRDTSVPMRTEDHVDLSRYTGLWYEIARFPVWFEKNCTAVTARYASRPDGKLTVVNSCHEGSPGGPLKMAEGIARASGPSNARLEVSFVPWLPFAWGDYWMLDVNDDYSVAVIGVPSGDAGWILARAPHIPEDQLDRSLAVLRANGYDTSRIEMTTQPDGGSAPADDKGGRRA